MEDGQKESLENVEGSATDLEFIPYVLFHKIHRNLRSSQVEIVPQSYYYREVTPEADSEPMVMAEAENKPPPVSYAPPLPALKERKNWWDFGKPVYGFNDPRIRSRIEKLMSSNIVYVTDRKYMVRLQEKIREDHFDNLKRRIQERETEEIEREKNLLLEGKITFAEAPKELKMHPVCRINQIANKIIQNKRAKIKTVDRTSAYKTSAKRIREVERLKRETVFEEDEESEDTSQIFATVCVVDSEVKEDVAKGLMYSTEDYDRLKYEDPQVKLLREMEVVRDMYELADKIVGVWTTQGSTV